MLHITNGDSAGGTIRLAGIGGEIISWMDVLHEGPVPAGLELEELSRVRARFIADSGWDSYEEASQLFARRDRALAHFRDHEEVVFWFEHDLFDQLQLIQILDWLHGRERGATRLRLICIGEFPGIMRFCGLGELNPRQMASLFPGRHDVTEEELRLGSEAWRAFRSPNPAAIEALLRTDTSALPFLAAALARHLAQFPSRRNGLSRTERQILEAVASGIHSRVKLFLADQHKEEHPFMGDSSFWTYLDRLSGCKAPLLNRSNVEMQLTPAGRDVLNGKADHVRLSGIDRWLGGVHLEGTEAAWRWDEEHRLLRPAG